MMRFPITELLDEVDCYLYWLDLLHPAGLACPRGHDLPVAQAPHKHGAGPSSVIAAAPVMSSLISLAVGCFQAVGCEISYGL
jgi:hypothetical protein